MSKKCNLTKWCILCRIGENRKWWMFMKYYINNYILLFYDFYIPFPNTEYISRNLDRWIHLPVGSRGRIFVQINLHWDISDAVASPPHLSLTRWLTTPRYSTALVILWQAFDSILNLEDFSCQNENRKIEIIFTAFSEKSLFRSKYFSIYTLMLKCTERTKSLQRGWTSS